MNEDEGKWFIALVMALPLLLIFVIVWDYFYSANDAIAKQCRTQGYFIADHHKYTCAPSGEWVEESEE